MKLHLPFPTTWKSRGPVVVLDPSERALRSNCLLLLRLFAIRACFSPCDSNGNASGNTLEEAILYGFLELVERDSVAHCAWITCGRCTRLYHQGPRCPALLTRENPYRMASSRVFPEAFPLLSHRVKKHARIAKAVVAVGSWNVGARSDGSRTTTGSTRFPRCREGEVELHAARFAGRRPLAGRTAVR